MSCWFGCQSVSGLCVRKNPVNVKNQVDNKESSISKEHSKKKELFSYLLNCERCIFFKFGALS